MRFEKLFYSYAFPEVEHFVTCCKLDDNISLSTMQHIVDTKKESPSSEDSLTDGSQNDASTKREESDEVKKVVICFNSSQALAKDCNKSEYKFSELQVSCILCVG